MENFVAEKEKMLHAHGTGYAAMKWRHWEEEVQYEHKFVEELANLMERDTVQVGSKGNGQENGKALADATPNVSSLESAGVFAVELFLTKDGQPQILGMVASFTPLPVIGIPLHASTLDGIDSLLSIVQGILPNELIRHEGLRIQGQTFMAYVLEQPSTCSWKSSLNTTEN
ncbi:hypothetical protein JHK87_043504 [Glycine soja]|nr:hypothetical protein JHK87_043504 [Glycine soja]